MKMIILMVDSTEPYVDSGILINSKFLDGLSVPDQSVPKTIDYLEKNKLGNRKDKLQIEGLGNIETKILGMSYSNCI